MLYIIDHSVYREENKRSTLYRTNKSLVRLLKNHIVYYASSEPIYLIWMGEDSFDAKWVEL